MKFLKFGANNDGSKDMGLRTTELGLLALTWIIVSAFYILSSLGAQGHLPSSIWFFIAAMVALSLAMHYAVYRWAPNSSQILLPIATLLNGIGYVEIARWNPTRAYYQAAWLFLSAIAFSSVLYFVKNVRDLDRYRFLTLLSSIFLLLLPLVPKIGIPASETGGARLWVKFGPISFQPIEIAKILLVFFFASYFAENRSLLSTPTQRMFGRNIVPPRVLVPILVAWGFSIAVLGAENDIGFAMLLFALFVSLLWLTTGLKTYVLLAIALFAAGGMFAAQFFSQIHARITLWLDPWSATNFAFSHQLAYGWFSLAAGGMTGTGLGLGQSGNIPEITSDMIFAAVGEELGFVGIVVVLALFAAFVGEGFRIAQNAHTDFPRIVAAGLSALLGLQAFFIMAGVLRILPFTGITLPFMAYGGSSLMANYIVVAILLRISSQNESVRSGGQVLAMTFD